MLDVPHVEQVQHFFPCRAAGPRFRAGTESLEVRLFDEREIPWDEIAFRTVRDYVAALFRRPAHRAVRDSHATRSRPRGPAPSMIPWLESADPLPRSNRRSRFRMDFSPHRTILTLSA